MKQRTRESRAHAAPVVVGVELEAYTLSLPDLNIRPWLSSPRDARLRAGGRFTRDPSIGLEYNSPPFTSPRTGLAVLRAALRSVPSVSRRRGRERLPVLLGAWTERCAGVHLHVTVPPHELTPALARDLATHLHAHLPLFIALCASSPVWAGTLAGVASSRLLNGSEKYFRPLGRRQLSNHTANDMLLNPDEPTKPPTLEIRVLDSTVPELIIAVSVLVEAVTRRWLSGAAPAARLDKRAYVRARTAAARYGMTAQLCWNGVWVSAARCLDRALDAHARQIAALDIPSDVWRAIDDARRGTTMSTVVEQAVRRARMERGRGWHRLFAARYAAAALLMERGCGLDAYADALGVGHRVDRAA